MKYTYACKKVSLNDSIKAYTEKKIAKLEKYFREDTTAFVTFSVEKDHRCTVEITVRSGGIRQKKTKNGKSSYLQRLEIMVL